MNQVKKVINVLFQFVVILLLVVLVLLGILKFFVFNKNSLNKVLEQNNYYENVSNSILDSMQAYMVSSGFPESILENIYTKEDIKVEVSSYIDGLFNGKSDAEMQTDVKSHLQENIDAYIKQHDLVEIDQKALDSFVEEMEEIYKDEVHFYGILDHFVSPFHKIEHLISVSFMVSLVLTIVSLIVLLLRKSKAIGTIFMSAGLILVFIKLALYSKIDVQHLLIISQEFSVVLRAILNTIGNYFLIFGGILIGFGLLCSIIKCINENHLMNKTKKN